MASYRLQRREFLQGLLATSMPMGLLSCSEKKANSLVVGGLPVTCNLTLPVACVAKAASNQTVAAGGQRYEFEYSKYNGWPEIK